jgi:hypothetical protein
MTVSTQRTSAPSSLAFKKTSRYGVLVALALLSVAIVILIISAAHPVSSNDLGVQTGFLP